MVTGDEIVKATCWGDFGPDCAKCNCPYTPVALQYEGTPVTNKWLQDNIQEADVVGNFIPKCNISQRIFRKEKNGITVYFLGSYLNKRTPKVIG